MLRNDDRRYGLVAQSIHWLTLVLLLAMFGLAFVMTEMPKGPDKDALYHLHRSIGATIFVLTLLRLLWRWVSPPPLLPAGMSAFERFSVNLVHQLLYLALLAQPFLGVLQSWAGGAQVVLFDTITLPSLLAPDKALKELLATAHSWTAWSLLALAAAHALAAIGNHVVRRDDVLLRMLPGTQDRQEKQRHSIN